MITKKLDQFQRNTVDGIHDAVQENDAVLVIAPTGGGKTGMLITHMDESLEDFDIAWREFLAASPESRGEKLPVRPKALVLERGINLQKQFADAVREWTGREVGHFVADRELNNEDPDIVSGMVQTIASEIKSGRDLEGAYNRVYVDECHHSYTEDDGELSSQYDYVISYLEQKARERGEEFKVVAATATDRRSDGRALDKRLAEAKQIKVTYQQVIDSGRIVEPKTIMPDYMLTNGQRVQEFIEDKWLDETYDFEADIAKDLRRLRPANFFDLSARTWKREVGNKRGTVFTPSLKDAQAAYEAFVREGVERVGVISDSTPEAEKIQIVEDYKNGSKYDVLINCRLVGEGFDDPSTGAVMKCGVHLSSVWSKQIDGRPLRSDKIAEKMFGLIIDTGATSYVHGRLEDQIKLENVQTDFSKARSSLEKSAVLSTYWHRENADDRLMVLPAKDKTYFAYMQDNGKFDVFIKDQSVGKNTKNKTAGTQLQRFELDGKKGAVSISDLARLTMTEIRENFGWHAAGRSADRDMNQDMVPWERLAQRRLSESKATIDLYLDGKSGQKIDESYFNKVVSKFMRAPDTGQYAIIAAVDGKTVNGLPGDEFLAHRMMECAKNPGNPKARSEMILATGLLLSKAVDALGDNPATKGDRKRTSVAAWALLSGTEGEKPIEQARILKGVQSVSERAAEALEGIGDVKMAKSLSDVTSASKEVTRSLQKIARKKKRSDQMEMGA